MCVYGIRKDIKERRIRELVKRYGNTGQTGSVGAVGVLLEVARLHLFKFYFFT